MAEDYKENHDINGDKEGFEEVDEFDGYEENPRNDEYIVFEEVEIQDEFDGYEESDIIDELHEAEEEYTDELLFEGDEIKDIKPKETAGGSLFSILTGVLSLGVAAAAIILLIMAGKNSLEGLKAFCPDNEEPKLTLMDIGNELDSIEKIGGDNIDEIIKAQTLRVEEAGRKALEESFIFDENESQKELIQVSLKLSSIVKDLKIKVVNDKDKLIANVPFEVEVQSPDGQIKTLRDDNKDGIIYLDNLAGGNYTVKTLSITGYEDKYSFDSNTSKIAVKETLEYKKVDVSDEIKKDTEVGNGEDAGKKPAQPVEEPEKEPEEPDNPDDVTDNDPGDKPSGKKFGIDVSKWNGDIDWAAVAASGVEYAIIRCGFRGSTEGGLIEDSKFYDNIKGASANGIKVGVYFFSQAVNEKEAVEEASMVLEMVKGYSISYPVFLDVETSGGGRGDRISAAERTQVCKAFAETVKSSGYVPGIYSNKTWFEENINVGELTSYKIWLAQYAKEVTYIGSRYDIWQYSDSGSVHGISTGVDLNISYLGY